MLINRATTNSDDLLTFAKGIEQTIGFVSELQFLNTLKRVLHRVVRKLI